MTDLPPVLTDGVVTLRPYRTDDVPDMIRTAQDPRYVQYTTVPAPYSEQDALQRIEQVRVDMVDGKGMYWAIEAQDGDRARFAGSMDVRSTVVRVTRADPSIIAWAPSSSASAAGFQ